MTLELHLGWQPAGKDRWCLGLSVENGRIEDRPGRELRAALRSIVERYRPEVRLTPNQDVLLVYLGADEGFESALSWGTGASDPKSVNLSAGPLHREPRRGRAAPRCPGRPQPPKRKLTPPWTKWVSKSRESRLPSSE